MSSDSCHCRFSHEFFVTSLFDKSVFVYGHWRLEKKTFVSVHVYIQREKSIASMTEAQTQGLKSANIGLLMNL